MCFRWSVKSKILEQRRRTGTGGRGDNLSLSLSVLPGLRRIYQLQFSSGNVRNVAGRADVFQREPTADLLDSFIDHWRSITNYYIQTTDDSRPASQTDIPWRLRQMTDILVYEEKQQEEPGRCLEFLLQNRLLETLCTLGKAQYPPGMSQQVLLFFSRLLSRMQKPLLQLVPIRTPVQKLIGLCALPGSCTEKEEAQFLLAVCSRVSQDPHMLRYILQPPDRLAASNQSPDAASSQSEASASSAVQSERGLLWVLLQLSSSQRPAVRLKACEGLLQLASLLDVGHPCPPGPPCPSGPPCPPGSPGPPCPPGELQVAAAQLGHLLAGRLQELYSLLPLEELQAAELRSWPRPSWRSESQADHMTRFLTWFDFLDELTADAPQALSQCVLQRWLMETLHPQLLNACEWSVLASTSVLCCVVRLVRSPSLLDQLLDFLLRTPSVLRPLLQRCDHASDQISVASLSLVDELLQKPHRDVLDTLVLGFLQSRRYLSSPAGGAEDRQPDSDGSDDGRDLEDDPFFSDGFPDDHLPPPRLRQPAAPGSAADIINSFLGLVPVQVRSAHLLQNGGYELYVLDARSLVSQCQALSLQWAWPQTPPPPPTCSSGEEAHFFEGHLLRVLFERLGRMLQQPYEVNLQLTAVLSRLCAFSHPLLDEYLLDPFVHLSAGSRSLFAVLVRVVGELMERIQQVADLPQRLLDTRRRLLGLHLDARPEHPALLQGVIVLEEFCKELAAIAFVKMPLDRNHDRFCSGPGSVGPEPAERS
ncbi:protein FAM160B2-like isoform X4 [Xiphophorus hellerii]|uniref:protein FAM160B2-like isoform X4 n=1 Tax=Xiphophorus hellerii TaxID=8084 RepID=UPI0013B4664E|nr:protein FAM160B2-like isoform X4 [Xiphophorus hellerii]